MKIPSYRVGALLILGLSGCALGTLKPVPPELRTAEGRYDALCDTWLNDDVSSLIRSWGIPTRQSPLPDGTIEYDWVEIDGNVVAHQELDQLEHLRRRARCTCDTRFTAKADGTLVHYDWTGDCDAELSRDPETGAWSI